MFTVALIGGDGAGKTTVAKQLIDHLPWRVKYLYMGQSAISGNIALPTTKLARLIKMKIDKKPEAKAGQATVDNKPTSDDLHYGYQKRNIIWKFFRFINRILEAIWRQLLTLNYKLKGYMVLYDRYVLFDAAPKNPFKIKGYRFFDHLEFFILYYFMPKPDLVLFLDAPPEVLYHRKGEASIKHLRTRREVSLQLGKKIKNFIRVDANRPEEQVFDEVISIINKCHSSQPPLRKRFFRLEERK